MKPPFLRLPGSYIRKKMARYLFHFQFYVSTGFIIRYIWWHIESGEHWMDFASSVIQLVNSCSRKIRPSWSLAIHELTTVVGLCTTYWVVKMTKAPDEQHVVVKQSHYKLLLDKSIGIQFVLFLPKLNFTYMAILLFSLYWVKLAQFVDLWYIF